MSACAELSTRLEHAEEEETSQRSKVSKGHSAHMQSFTKGQYFLLPNQAGLLPAYHRKFWPSQGIKPRTCEE